MFMPRAISSAIDKLARQSIGRDWGLYAALLDHWAEIVGVDYAGVTTPVKLSFPYQPRQPKRGQGTLTIRLPKGLAMEFSFKSEVIRRRVNEYFGHEAIARVALDPAAVPLPPAVKTMPVDESALAELRGSVAPVENAELQNALLDLGEAMLRGR